MRSAARPYVGVVDGHNLLVTETQPGRASVIGNDDDDEAAIQAYVRTHSCGHHALCCTAPFGEVQLLEADFRVKGADGLRVVDASAFPVIPGFFFFFLLAPPSSICPFICCRRRRVNPTFRGRRSVGR